VQVAYDIYTFTPCPLHLLYMRNDVAGSVLVDRFCHTVFGDQNREIVARSELLQNRIQAFGKHLPSQIIVLHTGGFVGFGDPAPEATCHHRQQRMMLHVDRPIIIQSDKVQRRSPRARCNPEKLLTIDVPSTRRLVLDSHVDSAVDDGIEEVLVVKIVGLPGRCRVITADHQHALH
jgi:hypothetical protein